MKYIKLYEELKDYYTLSEGIFFVVTMDESLVLRNDCESDPMEWPSSKRNKVRVDKINGGRFPGVTHYYSFETEQDANLFITNINKNSIEGFKFFNKIHEAIDFQKTIKYSSNIKQNQTSTFLYIDIKDNLKVVSYISGVMRKSDSKLFNF